MTHEKSQSANTASKNVTVNPHPYIYNEPFVHAQ